MAPKKPQPEAAKKRGGRPKGVTDPIPTTGFRIPPAVLARVDAVVAARNAELAAIGATVNRTSVIVAALTDYCDRFEAAKRGAS